MAHLAKNTDKTYPCIQCGSSRANIVREASTLDATRLKCSDCGMLYSAADSNSLVDKGEVPSGPPVIQEPVQPVSQGRGETSSADGVQARGSSDTSETIARGVPKSPSFVFISRDREKVEFSTKRDFKRTVLSWEHEGVKYDVFELNPKSVRAKIDIT